MLCEGLAAPSPSTCHKQRSLRQPSQPCSVLRTLRAQLGKPGPGAVGQKQPENGPLGWVVSQELAPGRASSQDGVICGDLGGGTVTGLASQPSSLGQMGFGVYCSQSRPEPRRGSDQVAGSRTAGRFWKELAPPSLPRPSSLPPLSSQGSTKWLPHHPPFCDPGRGGSLAGGRSEETTTQRPGWSQQQPPPPPSLGCSYTGAGARLRFGKAEPGVLATALPAWSRGHPGPGTTKQTSQ